MPEIRMGQDYPCLKMKFFSKQMHGKKMGASLAPLSKWQVDTATFNGKVKTGHARSLSRKETRLGQPLQTAHQRMAAWASGPHKTILSSVHRLRLVANSTVRARSLSVPFLTIFQKVRLVRHSASIVAPVPQLVEVSMGRGARIGLHPQ